MKELEHVLGIDIAKKTFDVELLGTPKRTALSSPTRRKAM